MPPILYVDKEGEKQEKAVSSLDM